MAARIIQALGLPRKSGFVPLMRSIGAQSAPQAGLCSGPATSGFVAMKRAPPDTKRAAFWIMSQLKLRVSPTTTKSGLTSVTAKPAL